MTAEPEPVKCNAFQFPENASWRRCVLPTGHAERWHDGGHNDYWEAYHDFLENLLRKAYPWIKSAARNYGNEEASELHDELKRLHFDQPKGTP